MISEQELLNRTYRVLVIEDDEQTALAFSNTLKTCYQTDWVRTAAHALARIVDLDKEPVHAVVLDLKLPNGEGLSLVQRFQNAVPHVPMVVVTGFDFNYATAIKAGAQEFLVKPVSKEDLLQAVAYAIVRHQVRQIFKPTDEVLASCRSALEATAVKIEEKLAAKPGSDEFKEKQTNTVVPAMMPPVSGCPCPAPIECLNYKPLCDNYKPKER